MHARALLTFSMYTVQGPLSQGLVSPRVKIGLLTSLNIIKITLLTAAKRLISQVTLDLIKVTTEINHHNISL